MIEIRDSISKAGKEKKKTKGIMALSLSQWHIMSI